MNTPGPVVTRFAPSPTGRLHAGHACSALLAHRFALQHQGRFLLRIEDIDHQRCHPGNIPPIYEDLAWLGIRWEIPVRQQSLHLNDYRNAAAQLEQQGLLYPCFCTRKDVQRELERAGRAPHAREGTSYPGTCRRLSREDRASRIRAGVPHSLRLDCGKAASLLQPSRLEWHDLRHGPQSVDPAQLNDEILVRKDIGTSYHLSVVHDDALQGVTHIIRGEDLFDSTPLHRLLQELLGFPTPVYFHHALLADASGRRLAKRDQALSLESLRLGGMRAEDFLAGLEDTLRAAGPLS